jgi:hypothetical protein
LPGLASFLKLFQNKPAFNHLGSIVALLEETIADNNYVHESSSDFALLGSGKQALYALYGVGLIGFKDKRRGGYISCHDGSKSELDSLDTTAETLIHLLLLESPKRRIRNCA